MNKLVQMQNEVKYQLSPKINRKKQLVSMYIHHVIIPDIINLILIISCFLIEINLPQFKTQLSSTILFYSTTNLYLFTNYQLTDQATSRLKHISKILLLILLSLHTKTLLTTHQPEPLIYILLASILDLYNKTIQNTKTIQKLKIRLFNSLK